MVRMNRIVLGVFVGWLSLAVSLNAMEGLRQMKKDIKNDKVMQKGFKALDKLVERGDFTPEQREYILRGNPNAFMLGEAGSNCACWGLAAVVIGGVILTVNGIQYIAQLM